MDEDQATFLSRQGGYDYEFVSPLDPKYECGICLLVLRSPHQTVCGHRFCKDCIINCISTRSVCPIDNQPLTAGDVFPDACIEREVLELLVLCPGHCHGCKRRPNLRNLQPHVQACNYQVVLCPNQCASTVLCGELQQHLQQHCTLRPTRCALCGTVYTLDKEQFHRAVCGDVQTPCEACGADVKRADVAHHVTADCPGTVLPCTYAEFGCLTHCKRSDMQQHAQDDMQTHLQLVSSAYKKMNTFVSELSRTVGLLQPSFSRQASLRSQVSASSPQDAQHAEVMEAWGCCNGSDGGVLGGKRSYDEEKDLKGIRNLDCRQQRENIAAEAQQHQLQLSNVNNVHGFSNKLSSNEQVLHDINDKTVDLDQRVLEETIRVDNLTKQLESMDFGLNEKITSFTSRLCNGDFVWKVTNFSARCSEIKSKNLSTYSPPFYTSFFGYKCCMRLNVNFRDNQHYLSLYIRFMKSEHDDVLEWPFQGHITLGILDQSSNSPKKHIVDSLDSNPVLQTFQRPTGASNDKSYGFTKFHPLSALQMSGSYVVNDVLYVQARVRPRDSFVDDVTSTTDGADRGRNLSLA